MPTQRSVKECDAIICAPGSILELETKLINGRLQRVYKRLPPSLRDFWLSVAAQHSSLTLVVFDNERWTYEQIFELSLKAAGVYREQYEIMKGDRVGICSRNYPEYMVAFWACQLVGAVPTLINAWLPLDALRHCIVLTECKLLILDAERADRLEHILPNLAANAGTNGTLVLKPQEGKGRWAGTKNWNDAIEAYKGDTSKIRSGKGEMEIEPEDNAAITFTSGTTGVPKGVLSTHRMFLTNLWNSFATTERAALRDGGNLPSPLPPAPKQEGSLLALPLFHGMGYSNMMINMHSGAKIVLMRKWSAVEGSKLVKRENVVRFSGVPSMALDIIASSQNEDGWASLGKAMIGGSVSPTSLSERAGKALPNLTLGQGYGLTETTSLVVGVVGEDHRTHPTSAGLVMPVNDVVIVSGDKVMPPGEFGEIWIRGTNVMKCYWNDPVATDKAITKDGWFRSGDIGYMDQEGFVYIKDRIKDIIIRGGENIDSTAVENALYHDERVSEAAAVAVPHPKLGEVVAAVVSLKPASKAKVTEASLIESAAKSLPKFALPVMILIHTESLERNATGKIMKVGLRKLAREEWEKRQAQMSSYKL